VFASEPQLIYGSFVLKLFNAELDVIGLQSEDSKNQTQEEGTYNEFEIKCKFDIQSPVNYSVITLNYDLVLESCAKYISSIIENDELAFGRPKLEVRKGFPYLAKLHGSVDDDNIIPPTWNKSLHKKIELEWGLAYKLLASANHIRILGYSLPENDAYVKYLLKSSLLDDENLNLRTIDVVCLDKTDKIREKFGSFITLKSPKYRFVSDDLRKYLAEIEKQNGIEQGHKEYFGQFL
jgi:hypothetical protein